MPRRADASATSSAPPSLVSASPSRSGRPTSATTSSASIYWSKNIIKGVPFSNTTYYSNPRVDALLEAAAVELDPAKRIAEFMEFQKIVMADAPDINIGVPRWYTIHNKRALGHSVTADGIEGNLAYAYIAA